MVQPSARPLLALVTGIATWLFLFVNEPASTQLQPIGPDGGTVQGFLLSPLESDRGFVSAATRDGSLWSSGDAGRTWRFAGSITQARREGGVVSGANVTALTPWWTGEMHAATGPNVEWCCFEGYWVTKGHIHGGEVTQLVPILHERVLIALVAPAPESGGPPRLERSTDGALSWSPAPLPNGARPLQLVVDPSPSGSLYVRTDQGVYVTRDAGVTWIEANHGLPENVASLAIAPSAPTMLYAVDEGNQLYRTTDRGERWRQRGAPVAPPNPIATVVVAQLVVDATDPSVLYATTRHRAGRRTFHTLHRSVDGALTWQALEATPESVASGLLASVSSSPPTLLAAPPDGGVLLSENQGETFVPSRGFYGATIEALATSVWPPSILYAGVLPQNVATTTGNGQWSKLPTLGPVASFARIRDLVADPRDPAVVWAADDVAVSRIVDAGHRIERTTLFGFGVSRLAVAPSAPATLYVVTSNDSCALRKSTDSGVTWSCPADAPPATPSARALEVDPADPDVVHLVDGSGTLFRSLDGAATWSPVSLSSDVTALAIDPLDGSTLYAGTDSAGIWKSLDRGASWFLLVGPLRSGAVVAEILAHPVDPDRLYISHVGPFDWGAFTTADGGITFRKYPGFGQPVRGVDPPSWLLSGPLAIDPALPSQLYVGTRGAGVWTVQQLVQPGPCEENDRTLCIGEGRFRVQARWRDFKGRTGPGHAVRLTPDTGYFWFFEPDNLELMVKALDGRPLNQRHWIFYGALSNVEFQMLVTDTETGQMNAYFNPERQFASRGDTSAFPREPEHAVRAAANVVATNVLANAAQVSLAPRAATPRTARADDDALRLGGGRFRISVEWRDFSGRAGVGHARPLNDTTGTFWFFEPENLELAIKVLDGRALNGHFWVFYGALSNVEYRIRVEDTATGEVRTYANASGQFASRGDTAAFPLQ